MANSASRIPILMYHQVSPVVPAAYGKYVVSPSAFAAQMRWLRVAGYQPVRLDDLLVSHTTGEPLPPAAIVITFDDGYRDCARYAADILKRYGFPAAFFPVAGVVGRTSRWLARERGFELPLADWAALRDLEAAGFECGAHSLTHPRLAELSDSACRHELATSRKVLEDGLGRSVVHLAYPFGSFNARVRDLAAEAGYKTACTVEPGFVSPGDDLLALRRIPVSGHDTLLDFAWRIRAGVSVGDHYRRFVRRWRSSAARQASAT